MSTAPAAAPGQERPHRGARFDADEYFGVQATSASELPDPTPLLVNLTRCVLEVLAGARDLEQIARWVTDDVYRTLLRRSVLAARSRAVKKAPVARPQVSIVSTRQSSPRDGVIEAVVIVATRVRVHAVAIRLEGLDRRWRASSISVL
jgi:hypothetical protein